METINKRAWLVVFLVLSSINVKSNGNHKKASRLDSIQIDGVWRSYRYHKPQFPGKNPRLVFVLHAQGMTSKSIQTVTEFEFNRLADETANTIVVYPQGYNGGWNYEGRGTSFNEVDHLDDVTFIRSIVKRMRIRHHIDYRNVFALGYLNGGAMCYKLAQAIPDVFKGFAIIGGNLSTNAIGNPLTMNGPVSMMMVNYTTEGVNPSNIQGKVNAGKCNQAEKLSRNETLPHWVKVLEQDDKNSLAHSTCTKLKYGNTFTKEEHVSLEKNKRVVILRIGKGKYPHPNPQLNQKYRGIENIGKDLDIPETIFNFFYQLQYSPPLQITQ